MSYLEHIKKTKNHNDTRWFIKYNKKTGLVREVKQVYNPSEYYAANKHKGENARPLHNKNALIKILENDKENRRDTQ